LLKRTSAILLDVAIAVAVACDEALEVAGFVEEDCEEVVMTVGEAIGGVGSKRSSQQPNILRLTQK
jgi:3-oxoacyl-(acyl-carrier-protein) synthase